ncbi:hypothetical protein T261_5082 [Streptomyces lydicus]|nr:hypothetical protein T261_5082 [Streptomyces lydicus]
MVLLTHLGAAAPRFTRAAQRASCSTRNRWPSPRTPPPTAHETADDPPFPATTTRKPAPFLPRNGPSGLGLTGPIGVDS